MDKQSIAQVAEQLQTSTSIGIICGGEPSIDTLGSALALSLGLQDVGKSTQVITKNPILAQHSRLVGVDKVEQQISGQKGYVIALPNAVDSIEKVSCYAEGQKLNIVLQPYPDVTDFNFNDVNFIKTGGVIDVLILIDIANMQEVNHLFGDQSQTPMIAMGKIVDQRIQKRLQSPGQLTSAIPVLALLQNMHAKISGDMASNLLQAIYDATQDFHNPNVTPRLFEDAAFLLKTLHTSAGKPVSPVPAAPAQPAMPAMPQPPMPGYGAMPRPQGGFPMPQAPGLPGGFPPPPPFPRPAQPAFGQPPMPQLPKMPQAPFPAPGNGGFESAPQPLNRPPMPQPEQLPRGVAKEWEIDEDFEFDKAPDQQYFRDQSMTRAPQQQQPQPNPHRDQGGQRQKQQNQPKQQPKGGHQNQPQRQQQAEKPAEAPKPVNQPDQPDAQPAQEEDWLSPKIYKTEDLL